MQGAHVKDERRTRATPNARFKLHSLHNSRHKPPSLPRAVPLLLPRNHNHDHNHNRNHDHNHYRTTTTTGTKPAAPPLTSTPVMAPVMLASSASCAAVNPPARPPGTAAAAPPGPASAPPPGPAFLAAGPGRALAGPAFCSICAAGPEAGARDTARMVFMTLATCSRRACKWARAWVCGRCFRVAHAFHARKARPGKSGLLAPHPKAPHTSTRDHDTKTQNPATSRHPRHFPRTCICLLARCARRVDWMTVAACCKGMGRSSHGAAARADSQAGSAATDSSRPYT